MYITLMFSHCTGHCWHMTTTAHEHSMIEVRVKVMWNCSIVVIALDWLPYCVLYFLHCAIKQITLTLAPWQPVSYVPLWTNSWMFWNISLKAIKNNNTQKLYCLCLRKQSIIIIGNTLIIIIMINIVSHEKLKVK